LSTSANAATKVTTDVLPKPAIFQIQDNGNDLEEEGGDDFVDIDDMLLDELDLEELDFSGLLRRFMTATTAATTATTTATATAATTARTVAATAAATAATTAATTQRKRSRPKGSKDKELGKRRQKATGGGDITATRN
jgi:hypothetical protein